MVIGDVSITALGVKDLGPVLSSAQPFIADLAV